jgi:cytochrome b-561 domain containing protein 2
MLWITAQVAIGGGSVWFDGAAFGGGVKAKALWKYHRYVDSHRANELFPKLNIPLLSLSGYILFPMLLFTVNLGGAWSNWGQKYTSAPVRVLAFVIAPAALLTAVYSRVRFVLSFAG